MATKMLTTKITPVALRIVRMLAGITEETQPQVLERLLRAELARVAPALLALLDQERSAP